MKKISLEKLREQFQKKICNKKNLIVDIASKLKFSTTTVNNAVIANNLCKNQTMIAIARELDIELEVRENISGKEFWVKI